MNTRIPTAALGIGRISLELPVHARVTHWYQFIHGLGRIQVNNAAGLGSFEAWRNRRIEESRQDQHPAGVPLLVEARKYSHPDGLVLCTWPLDLAPEGRICEFTAYCLVNGTLFSFQRKGAVAPASRRVSLDAYGRAFKALSLRATQEGPVQPGMCIEKGFLADWPSVRHTGILMAEVRWPQQADLRLGVIITNLATPEPPLLQRTSPKGDPHVLRFGARRAGLLEGEEILERIRERNGTEGHLFTWETPGHPSRWDAPRVQITLSTGQGRRFPVQSSLTTPEALAAWDQLLASLKLQTE